MLGQIPTKYRSRFSGMEIDALLASISTKIDLSYIVNDFSGGEKLVASAEIAKQLFISLQRFDDPNYIKSLILSIPNSIIFTQEDKDKINRLAGFFQGSFPTIAARNLAVPTLGFTGGELTFIVNDGNGVQELSYWDVGSLTWKKSKFVPDIVSASTNFPTAGTVVAISMDKVKYSTAKYQVRAETDTAVRMFEVMVVIKNANVFWTVANDIGDLTSISVASAVIVGNVCQISFVVSANTIVKFSRLSEF